MTRGREHEVLRHRSVGFGEPEQNDEDLILNLGSARNAHLRARTRASLESWARRCTLGPGRRDGSREKVKNSASVEMDEFTFQVKLKKFFALNSIK